MGILLNLDRNEWFVALTFGVLVDADHLLATPRYVSDNGLAAILRPTWDDGSGFQWRSLFHDPIAFGVVAPLAIGWRFLIPLLFWGTHIGMDYLQIWTIDHSALVEAVVFALACTGIVFVEYRRWKITVPKGGLREFLFHISASFRSYLSARRASSH
ncbi:MAG: hypothetical protein ACUVT7_04640 [Thermoplasmata archaeon]